MKLKLHINIKVQSYIAVNPLVFPAMDFKGILISLKRFEVYMMDDKPGIPLIGEIDINKAFYGGLFSGFCLCKYKEQEIKSHSILQIPSLFGICVIWPWLHPAFRAIL